MKSDLPEPTVAQHEMRRMVLAALILAAVTLIAFSPLLTANFVQYDDHLYVTGNPRVQAGMTWDNVKWAFSNIDVCFYYPLTWLSHMVDCQLFGLHGWGHHLTSVLFHMANTLLLLVFLWRTTGAFWRSLAVAALFALHPLHVESVAWISERKDVLSTFFLMLTFLAYAHYAKKPGLRRYSAVFLLMLAGLMAKSMVVTAPFLLLLLDGWPLRRGEGEQSAMADATPSPERGSAMVRRWRRLIVEKIPLFALSGLFGVVTLVSQSRSGAVSSLNALPILARMENVVIGYAAYLVKTVFPVHLAAFYPIPDGGWPWLEVVGSILLLCVVTLLVWRLRRGRPYLLVGWLWFLAAVAPVSGIFQVGQQAYADRYTYVALIGVFLMLVWGGAEAAWHIKALRPNVGWGVVGLIALGLTAMTWRQCRYWQNGISLFTHSLEVGGLSHEMLNSLGASLTAAGRAKEAIPVLKQATLMDSHSVEAWGNLGNAFRDVGKLPEASACYRRVLELDPTDVKALHNLGGTLEREGKLDEALDAFRRQAALQPDNATALLDVGRLLAQTGKLGAAEEVFRRAVAMAPDNAGAHYCLGLALNHLGRTAEAMDQLHQALVRQPDWGEPWNTEAKWTLAQASSDPSACARAVRLAQKACALTGEAEPEYLATLMEAHALCGDREAAGAAAHKAMAAARAGGNEKMALGIEARWMELSAALSPGR